MPELNEQLATLLIKLRSKAPYQDILSQVFPVVEYLKSHPESVRKVWHPLGFLMTNLGQVSKTETLRLHIWPDNARSVQEPPWLVHNHVWDLESHILCGRVSNQFYSIKSDKKSPTNRVYRVRYTAHESIMVATDELVTCTASLKQEFVPGGHYSIYPGKFHSTEVSENQFTSTLVIAENSELVHGNPNGVGPEVIGDLEGRSEYCYNRISCSVQQFVEIIENLFLQLQN